VSDKSESRIQWEIRLALGGLDGVWARRNNVGLAEVRGVKIPFGLGKGSSDLIGIVTMPDGVGRFAAWEIKNANGMVSKEQELFFGLVRGLGGFACEVRSPEDAVASVARCRGGCDR
jgi:hypothetical protein